MSAGPLDDGFHDQDVQVARGVVEPGLQLSVFAEALAGGRDQRGFERLDDFGAVDPALEADLVDDVQQFSVHGCSPCAPPGARLPPRSSAAQSISGRALAMFENATATGVPVSGAK